MAAVTLTNAANLVPIPGYPASVDRVERNAIDAIVGDPVNTGTSLRRFYLYFDLIAIALLAALGWPAVRAARALRARTRPRHRRRAIAGVLTRAAAGGLLLALPALTLGWQVSLLWHPDLSALVLLTSALLLVTGALRLVLLVQRVPKTPQEAPVFATAPEDTSRAPASLAR
jgi:fatty acid desaturase